MPWREITTKNPFIGKFSKFFIANTLYLTETWKAKHYWHKNTSRTGITPRQGQVMRFPTANLSFLSFLQEPFRLKIKLKELKKQHRMKGCTEIGSQQNFKNSVNHPLRHWIRQVRNRKGHLYGFTISTVMFPSWTFPCSDFSFFRRSCNEINHTNEVLLLEIISDF